MEAKKTFGTVDEYIATFPKKTKDIIKKLRQTIKKAAPEAEELISYGMPAYKLHGMLIFFAVWKEHIGIYPTPSGIAKFKKELAPYEGAKGSVKFPIDEAFPFDLLTEIVKFRVNENTTKALVKANAKAKTKVKAKAKVKAKVVAKTKLASKVKSKGVKK